MANALLICSRARALGSDEIDRLDAIRESLTPDKLTGAVSGMSSRTEKTTNMLWPAVGQGNRV